MRSTFFGLNIGISALQAQQRALDVTSHNIANANTEGYSRQSVIMGTNKPIKTSEGYVGTGVNIQEIRRIRDQFVDTQIRNENKVLGEWETKSDILSKIELIINEPSESSLRSVIDEYWASWQQLSKSSENTAARGLVVQNGINLVDTFSHMDRLLSELQTDINSGIQSTVNELNSLSNQIVNLNDQIVKAELGGVKANDLRDRRELLVEQLSELLPLDIVEDQTGAITITGGGATLVSGSYAGHMGFSADVMDPTQAELQWINSYTGNTIGSVTVNGGKLKGYLDMRDKQIDGMKEQFSNLAERIAEEVNALHSAGSGLNNTTGLEPGLDFFVKKDLTQPFSANNIAVNQELIDDSNKVAASTASPVIEGDSSNALAIAQLDNKLTMNPAATGNYTATFDDFYTTIVSQLGIVTQEAERMYDNQTLLVEQLVNRRASVSGVSLDEEMANMIKYQHSYTAAARIINTMDEMLDLIVNRLGLMGR
ncbi:MAG: flagellar hook-associated protein FlgK [Firmicutes bacterium HGW-Firmicutes-12]|nr:MAG: flagellar hook-associated protein FlgK [Firmicutes bacterium HGW-Firmicutes-12]